VHYFEAGEGAPLLLLHAVPRSARCFRRLLPLLAPHVRAIAVDTPGFGQSDPLPGKVTMESLAGAMIELLDALGIDRAHVFGLHTGNKVAAAIAADHGPRIDRLVLCGQIHSIIPDQDARNDAIRALVAKYFTDYPASPNGDEHLRRWLADWSDVAAFALPRSLYGQGTISERDIAHLKVRVLDHVQALSGVRGAYAANFRFDLANALRRISAPTLLLELVVPHEEHYGRQLESLLAMLPDARGATIENADGNVIESRPGEVAQHLVDFLTH
jgi:pimeloyl-ACP methyl ester carboxylesterase